MQESRLFKILYYLVEHGKATAPELASQFEVSVRTIYRDIDMISSAGIPLYATTGRNGGITIGDDFVLDKILFSDQEKQQILTALRSVALVSDDVQATLTKLAALFKMTGDAWLEIDFTRWGNQRQDHQTFQTLKTAIIQRKKIRMTYVRASGDVMKREICPLKLVYKAKAWYLQAYCLKKEDYRLFKLTRMMEIELLDETFGSYHYPEIPKQEQQQYPMIVLAFRQSQAYRVYDEFETDQITKETERLIVQTRMPIDDWLIGYLLSFGQEVEVIKPAYLKQMMIQQVKKLYEYYQP